MTRRFALGGRPLHVLPVGITLRNWLHHHFPGLQMRVHDPTQVRKQKPKAYGTLMVVGWALAVISLILGALVRTPGISISWGSLVLPFILMAGAMEMRGDASVDRRGSPSRSRLRRSASAS
jgi:galactitol-specific phosphotransferase system IIC component